MALTLLVGGARSGKSELAVQLASKSDGPVVVVATAEARDPEMEARITRHRERRPDDWTTVEAPLDLLDVVGRVPDRATLLLDCLTLWVANLTQAGADDPDIVEVASRTADTVARRQGFSVAVTNDVGSGVVPASVLGRRFRDLAGRVNAVWASAAERTALVVAGKVLRLDDPEVLW